MKVALKISRALLQVVRSDLVRPHPFAWERVSFLCCRPGVVGHDEIVILAESVHSVADDDYVENDSVGAMMGSTAIRKALQIAHSNRISMFHVHMHEHFGRPCFSGVDLRESAVFMPDFWHVCPSHPHGTLVLSENSALGLCWYPGIRHPLPIGEIVVVGAPMEVIQMYQANNRQGFLGPNHEDVLARYRVAVVGVGGGGSHFAQQLAHIGIGRVCVFDSDYMAENNQNREVGSLETDIVARILKVDIAERLMRGIRSSTKVVKIAHRWQERAEILRGCHIVFGCLDSFSDRAELEVACRRYMQPLIDIGMDVHSAGDEYAIGGQVILSMPGSLCMRCVGFITDQLLAKEASRYGVAGPRAQVIWPNGVLASAAIGVFMQLVTPWHKKHTSIVYLEYDGNANTLMPSNRLRALQGRTCPHFSGSDCLGDPFWNPEILSRVDSVQGGPVQGLTIGGAYEQRS